jgi:hypothetical protein
MNRAQQNRPATDAAASECGASVRVNVRAIAMLSDADDSDVEGLYQVTLGAGTAGRPAAEQAAIALDAFHGSVAIGELEAFEISVLDAEGRAIDEWDTDTCADAAIGVVEKISDEPLAAPQ